MELLIALIIGISAINTFLLIATGNCLYKQNEELKQELERLKYNSMKLKDFLRLISDDDARIELQLDLDNEDEYLYTHFWLSDYLLNSPDARKYENWIVQSISFEPLIEEKATILIQINNHYV